MDDHSHHQASAIARIVTAVAALIIAICFAVMVVWMVSAQQNTKLYEADNVVCASQPFSIQCFERKTRP